MTHLQSIIQEAKRTGETIVTVTNDNSTGKTLTEWTATPQENGAVELTYKIVKIKST